MTTQAGMINFLILLGTLAAPAVGDHYGAPTVMMPPPPPIVYRPEPRSRPHGPEPRTEPSSWIFEDDYPSAALRDLVEGKTDYTLLVGTDGRPQACAVAKSSGSPALDEATCTLIMRRGRFWPAMDASGKPVVGSYSSGVTWQFPRDPHYEQGETTIDYVVEANGRVTGCKSTTTVAPGLIDPPCEGFGFLEPYTDKTGKPVRRQVHVKETVTVSPTP